MTKHIALVAFILSALFAAPAATAQDRETLFRNLFDTLYANKHFNGCVLVADSGRPIFKAAYGFADIEKNILLKPDTRFELASVSKQFTAVAIMQLQEQGKLAYTDDIRKYLPELPYKKVTIEDLLRHTSGINDFLGWGAGNVDTAIVNSNEDLLKVLPKNIPDLSFKPGTKFSYSNTNYLLLALIVSKITGQPFAQYMQEKIFKPAGMTNTSVYSKFADKQQPGNYANSYQWDPGEGKLLAAENFTGNGYLRYLGNVGGPYGISSNIDDLLKWDQALYGNKLVSEETFRKAVEPKYLNDSTVAGVANSMPYGFGWILSADSSDVFMWHTGGLPGYTSLITRFTKRHRTVIVLQNIWGMIAPTALMVPVAEILDYNKDYAIPFVKPFRKSKLLKASELKPYVGNYKDNNGIKMVITQVDNRLYAKFMDQVAAEILLEERDTFFYRDIDAAISFEKTKEGGYNHLTLSQNGAQLRFSRID